MITYKASNFSTVCGRIKCPIPLRGIPWLRWVQKLGSVAELNIDAAVQSHTGRYKEQKAAACDPAAFQHTGHKEVLSILCTILQTKARNVK